MLLCYGAEMYRASGERVWYYFTQRRRKHRHGNVVDRTAAGGYWERVTAPEDIMHNRRVIGSCRLFAYFTGKRQDSVRTNWMMQEFTAPENRVRVSIFFCGCRFLVLTCVVVVCRVHIKWRLSSLLLGRHDEDPLFGVDLVVNLELLRC